MSINRTPGVYFETRDTAIRGLDVVRTDIAGFVGIAWRGPLHTPIRLESWNQFLTHFGGPIAAGHLALAVRGFFANGGRTCWVVRVANPDQARAASVVVDQFLIDEGTPSGAVVPCRPAFRFTAASRAVNLGPTRAQRPDQEQGFEQTWHDPGRWGNGLKLTIRRSGHHVDLTITLDEHSREEFRDLSLEPDHARFLVRIVNGDPRPRRDLRHGALPNDGAQGSKWVHVTDLRGPDLLIGEHSGRSELLFDRELLAQGRSVLKLVREASFRLGGGRDGLSPMLELPIDQPGCSICLRARPSLASRSPIAVEVTPQPSGGDVTLTFQQLAANSKPERFANLPLVAGSLKTWEKQINDPIQGSRLVDVEVVEQLDPAWRTGGKAGFALPKCGGGYRGELSGGLELRHLTGEGGPASARWGLSALETIPEVSQIAIPDLMPHQAHRVQRQPPDPKSGSCGRDGQSMSADRMPGDVAPALTDAERIFGQQAMVAHCERLQDRMAILDDPFGRPASFDELRLWCGAFDTSRAAGYYPWVGVSDPSGRGNGFVRVPPSGLVAGLMARIDLASGPHVPPANQVLESVVDLAARVSEYEHADLNSIGVNVIKTLPGRGIRVMGARTFSGDPTWRFVNVRRLLTMIEQSLDAQTQWIVFEPNDLGLQVELGGEVRSFLLDLWRKGMLEGGTPDEAFFVRCDETTNPPEETDLGRLICLLGVNPPAPAEFVIVRIGRTDTGGFLVDETAPTGGAS